MVNTGYYSINMACQAIPSPKQKSGKRNMFRRISMGKSDSSSQPSVESLSEEFRDEASIQSDEKNRTSREGASSHGLDFDPFESIPSWGFDKNSEMYANRSAKPIESPEEFEAFQIETKIRSTQNTKRENHKYQPESSRSVSVPSAAKKLDQWSKSLTRKKNQFKYHSFVNEKRVYRKKKNREVESSFEKLDIEDRNDLEQTHNRPEDFPSLNDLGTRHELFISSVIDGSQGNLIGPLMPNTKLNLAAQESPNDSSRPTDFEDIVEPPCENLVLESVFLKNNHVVPKSSLAQNDHTENNDGNGEQEESESGVEVVYEATDYPSEADYSTVFSGATENLPLLKAFGMNMVDCNNCGSSKTQKKMEAKKKRAEAKKKIIEDLWERKHFYWKYESVEDQRRQHLELVDSLIFKIAPEQDDDRGRAQIEMPLGLQLSTITEGDEDFTACCSPRSGVISQQKGGKVTVSIPCDSLLENKRDDDEGEVDEVEGFPREPEAKAQNNEITHSPKPENPRQSRRSKGRMRVVSVNEILIPDDGSAGDSRGNISDITEDYLHIPFSSPLYKKVLKAFREAAEAQENGNHETTEEMKQYLQWV